MQANIILLIFQVFLESCRRLEVDFAMPTNSSFTFFVTFMLNKIRWTRKIDLTVLALISHDAPSFTFSSQLMNESCIRQYSKRKCAASAILLTNQKQGTFSRFDHRMYSYQQCQRSFKISQRKT